MNRLLRCFCNFTVCLALLLFPTPTAHALTALFTDGTTLASLKGTDYYAAFHRTFANAAKRWDAGLSADITIRVTLEVTSDNIGGLAGAAPNGAYLDYGALAAVLPTIPATPPPIFTGNQTGQSADASRVYVTNAQMKALGVYDTPLRAVQSSGFVVWSLSNAMDWDPGDGIGPGLFDAEAVAVHELGHVLGFLSSGDAFRVGGEPNVIGPTILDLFRFNDERVRSLAPGVTTYFSSDGGKTLGPRFARGVPSGGPQSSHWDVSGLVMNSAFAAGEHIEVQAADYDALAVTGLGRANTSAGAAEPGTGALVLFLLLTLWAARRHRAE